MSNSKIVRAAALLASSLSLLSFAPAKSSMRDGGHPVVFSCNATAVYPGEALTIEIDLDGTTTSDQVVTLSSCASANWADLPATVCVKAGESCVKFVAHVSSTAIGILDGEASCNGETVGTSLMIIGMGSK